MSTTVTHKIERLPAVMARTGLGRSSVYVLLAQGRFPRPVKLTGGRAMGFVSTEIDAWIAERASARG